MEKVFIGLRPLGPDTVVATAKYIKKNDGERERKRAELHSYQKAKAIETKNRFCTTCGNLASQMALYRYDGATRMERYCQSCIDSNKHLKENELMDNFDNLFIKAEHDTPIYEQVHARNHEE
jgi:ribosomal protein S27AE